MCLCVFVFLLSSCESKPVLRNAIENHSIGVLSVVWNPHVQIEGRDAVVSLWSRHIAPLTDSFLRGLVNASNSWVRDASSVALQSAFAFYPDAPPPKKDGLALTVVYGYKWVLLQNPAAALHWCSALNVDTVLTAVLTPKAVFSNNDIVVTMSIDLTVFNRQEGRVFSDSLDVKVPLSEEAKKWVLRDPSRLPNVLISHDVVMALNTLYTVPAGVSTGNRNLQ